MRFHRLLCFARSNGSRVQKDSAAKTARVLLLTVRSVNKHNARNSEQVLLLLQNAFRSMILLPAAEINLKN